MNLSVRTSVFGNGLRAVALVLLLCSGFTMDAATLTREQAQARVEQFLQDKGGSRRLAPVRSMSRLSPRHGAPANAQELYYVFDRGTDEGFVIASADDRTLPVLGYCDQGSFDYDKLPDAMKEWLEGYAEELRYLQNAPQARAAAALPTHPAIAPLMTTKWNQGDPFNLYCPDFFGKGRSVTGCVATAMAQVLYYNRAKSTNVTLADMPGWTGRKKDEATGQQLQNEGVAAGAVIDWDNMIDNYNDGKGTTKQKQAVAWLMHLCGVAVKMDYSNSGSGAYSSDVPKGCINYFGYRNDCRYLSRSSYSAVEFDAIVYDQLAQGKPMYMSGGGHAYVCDGYHGDRYYHINWGWGGGGPDGYYLLSKLTPGDEGIGGNGGFGYSSGLGVVIEMEPADFGEKAVLFADATVKKTCVEHWDKNGDGELSFDEAADVTDLGTAFQATRIKTFNELRYFTRLGLIADEAFQGCTALTSIIIPENVQSIGARAFSGCTKITSMQLPTSVTAIGEEAFSGCTRLAEFSINEEITVIEPRTFQGCTALTSINIPAGIKSIGEQAFGGCTKLKTVSVDSQTPQNIQLGANVFEGLDLSGATLNAMQGTREFFETAEQWKEFGNLHFARVIGADKFMELTPGRPVYLWNVGKKSYLARGEMTNIQNVLSEEPMRFIIYEGEDEHAGLYYIYSPDVTTQYKYTARRTGTAAIGADVKYTVINANLAASCYWTVRKVADGVYTFQVPEGYKDYDPKAYFGVQFDHENQWLEEGSSTMATYYDVPYEGHEQDCQWMFVDYLETYGVYEAAQKLEELLKSAVAKGVDVSREQRVLDDLTSTYEDVMNAQVSVRKKLGFITTEEETLMSVCLDNWDLDGDGEFSQAEAEMVTEISNKFNNLSKLKDFGIIKYFSNLSMLPSNAFLGCSAMEKIELPTSLTIIDKEAFKGCKKLSAVTLPEYVVTINTAAFEGCTGLRTLTMTNPEPETIDVTQSAFTGLGLGRITLQVPIGCKERYAALLPWSKFGNIVEVRTRTYPKFSPVMLNTDGYIYNVGTRKYLCGGEAYGTQAVVGSEPYVYQIRRQNSMGSGIYYLYSDDTPNQNHLFFRSQIDSKVGSGVKSCFIDGGDNRLTDKNAWWQFAEVEGLENVFTLQVPKSIAADYVPGEYLGIQTDHETKAVDKGGTWGTYWDIPYEGNERNCQWAFIALADVMAAEQFDVNIAELSKLIGLANAKSFDTTAEQAVLDDLASTPAQVYSSLAGLCEKLHLILFTSQEAKQLCLNSWDLDNDDEISFEEAASVKDLGTVFKNRSELRSFDEFRYFTGITEIPNGAFRGTGLFSIYIPASVKVIHDGAFTSSSKLRYLAFLGEDASSLMQSSSSAGLSKSATFFVPKKVVEAYQSDAFWSAYKFEELTGTPVVSVGDNERLYGYTNSRFGFTVTGAPINGEPVITCDVESTTPVGKYPIVAQPGSITTANVVYNNGVYTINPAPLTVTAKSYTREVGEENPTFEYTVKGFRNKETVDVLTTQPTIECDATKDSPWGEYEIRVGGAEAQNYTVEYVSGKLTINPPVGINDLSAAERSQPIFDLTGRRIADNALGTLPRGIYVIGGRRVVIK